MLHNDYISKLLFLKLHLYIDCIINIEIRKTIFKHSKSTLVYFYEFRAEVHTENYLIVLIQ